MKSLEDSVSSAHFPYSTLSISLPSRKFYERLGYANFQEQAIDVGEGQLLNYWRAKKVLHEVNSCDSSNAGH